MASLSRRHACVGRFATDAFPNLRCQQWSNFEGSFLGCIKKNFRKHVIVVYRSELETYAFWCIPNSEIRSVSTVKDVKIACMYIMYSDPCLQARQDCQTPRFSAMDHQRSCLRSFLCGGDALDNQYIKRVPLGQLSPINQLFLVSLCK